MNAFTREETAAINLTGPRNSAAWKSEQLLPARQQITYLPIVDARTAGIVGYRAAVNAAHDVFDCMRMQIMNSPTAGLLFIELDAANCLKKGCCQANHLCALFMQEAWTDRELVIQLRRRPQESSWQSQRRNIGRGAARAT